MSIMKNEVRKKGLVNRIQVVRWWLTPLITALGDRGR